MVLPAVSSDDSVHDTATGSTVAETLQGLIGPGSTVYASSTAVASSTMDTDATSEFQMSSASTSASVPPPVAILAPATQQGAGDDGSSEASTAAVSAQPQQAAVCQLVQPSPQGLMTGQDGTSLQGVMSPAGTATVYGSGTTQIISTVETAAVQSQVICIIVS